MDVDAPPSAEVRQGAPTPSAPVQVEVDAPFDLDQLAANYRGRTKISRLLFIASSSPALAGPALTLALSSLKSDTLDVQLYEQVFHSYRQTIASIEQGLGESNTISPLAINWYESIKQDPVPLDRSWIEQATKEGQNTMDKLQVELKGYSTNLIKESIRMGHRDLAQHQYKMGDLQGAIRSYTKSREFCTTSQHILEMCIGVIEIALELSNYSFIRNYVLKALSALDSLSSSSKQGGGASSSSSTTRQPAVNLPGMLAPSLDASELAREKDRQATMERLKIAGAVADLGLGHYEQAARGFTTGVVGRAAWESREGHFIPPPDIALYATILSLATFSRSDIQKHLLENADLRVMLDPEPWLRDVVRAFQAGRWKEGFGGLERYSARQSLDPHLSPHLPSLLSLIKSRSLLSHFSPFSVVSLSLMSTSFGWTESYLLHCVTDLIQSGQMKARVDRKRGVLVARREEKRGEAFKRALGEGERMVRRERGAQWRLKLIQSDILVKPPKHQPKAQQQEA